MTATAGMINEQQRAQFHDEGYFILEEAISAADLAMLREECDSFIAKIDAEMDQKGIQTNGISHKGNRYFISNRYKESARLHEFLFGELMAEVCRVTLGDGAFLFHEQFVVKAAEKGMKFAWHQDSGYVGYPHRAYVTCWCTLDDVTEENGTVYILPYSRAGNPGLIEHIREEGTNDLVGYHGDDPGIPVIAPAGSVAVFSSLTFHRSGRNQTPHPRRIYLPQYSAEPIIRPNGQLHAFAEPLLRGGERVGR